MEVLICASEQSFLVGLAARGPNTLRYRSGRDCRPVDLGTAIHVDRSLLGVAPPTVSCRELPLLKLS